MIQKPADIKLTTEIYRECQLDNPDGVGIAYVDENINKLVVVKDLMDFKTSLPLIQGLEERELLIHFRKSNRGMTDQPNCHPFLVELTDEYAHIQFAIAHNGTLPWMSTNIRSDTRCWVEDITPALQQNPWLFDQEYNRALHTRWMTSANKIIIWRWDAQDKILTKHILNENEGNKNHGCWFSNYSWKSLVRVPYGYASDYDSDHLNGMWKETPYAKKLLEMKQKQAEFDMAHGKVTNNGKVLALTSAFEKEQADRMAAAADTEYGDDASPSDDFAVGLIHLNRKEKKDIYRFTSDLKKLYEKAGMGQWTKGLSMREQVEWAREQCRYIKGAKNLKAVDIDNMIIIKHITPEEVAQVALDAITSGV